MCRWPVQSAKCMEGPRGLQAWPHRCAVALPVDATTDLDLSDARPLLALFAERTDYPRWTLSLLDSGQVQAQATLRWRPGHLVIDGLQAENDRLSVRARLDLLDQRKRGDLYLRWGCWVRASSWTVTSASGTWPRHASGLISGLPCCQRAGNGRRRFIGLKAGGLHPFAASVRRRNQAHHGAARYEAEFTGFRASGMDGDHLHRGHSGAWASASAASFYTTLALPRGHHRPVSSVRCGPCSTP